MDALLNILLLNIHYNLPVHRAPTQRHGGGGGTSDARPPLTPLLIPPAAHTLGALGLHLQQPKARIASKKSAPVLGHHVRRSTCQAHAIAAR